jgi:hypothetical protein
MKPRRNEEAQAHIGLSSHRKKNVLLRERTLDWINMLGFNPESVALVEGLCDLVGPVTVADACSAPSFDYILALALQQKKIKENLSGKAKSSR